ncbi:Abi family protein [Enterococcus faecalis]
MEILKSNEILQQIKESLLVEEEEKIESVNYSDEQRKILKKAEDKELLSIEEQIMYLDMKGIGSGGYTINDIKTILSSSTYYYKLTVYRKNFKKKSNGKYENLNIQILKDLSNIDMELRYLCMKFTLDIEHILKTNLISSITDDLNIDGYDIVDSFNKFQKDKNKAYLDKQLKFNNITIEEHGDRIASYEKYTNSIIKKCNRGKGFDKELYEKYKDRMPIWVMIEIMSYDNLVSFIEFYYNFEEEIDGEKKKMFNANHFRDASIFLKYSKNIRNCSAHSRPIIHDITELNQIKSNTSKRTVHTKLKNYGIDKLKLEKEIVNNSFTNWKIHDLLSTMLLHDKYVTNKDLRKQRKHDLYILFKRFYKNRKLYSNNSEFVDISKIMMNVVKFYNI